MKPEPKQNPKKRRPIIFRWMLEDQNGNLAGLTFPLKRDAMQHKEDFHRLRHKPVKVALVR